MNVHVISVGILSKIHPQNRDLFIKRQRLSMMTWPHRRISRVTSSIFIFIVIFVLINAILCITFLGAALQTEKGLKNKMKPTNPNADTYVDKQRQYLFVTFPTNSLVRHPEFTHWGDTLVGHPCLTLLSNSCLTLLWDTLVRHFLLDTLVRHSYLTFL